MAAGLTPRSLSLMPREHGAYAQLGIALAMALAFVPHELRAWGQALAAVLAFLASEPTLVVLGRRGGESKRGGAARARRRLGGYLLVLVLLLPWVWAGSGVRQFLSLLPALAFGTGLLRLFLVRREHSLAGELLAAAAFSFAGLPVMAVGGLDPSRALLPILGLAALNGLGTALIRSILTSRKRMAGWPRLLPVLLGLALAVGAGIGSLSWPLILAPLPLTLLSLWAWGAPAQTTQLRRLGWLLTLATALGALALVLGRGAQPLA